MSTSKWIWLLFIGLVGLAGCSGGDTADSENELPIENSGTAVAVSGSVEVDLDTIPAVDTSQHNVPLQEIYFDTFGRTSRAVPLNEASSDLIRSLLDAIPPIYNPVFEEVATADNWLDDDALVLGYADGGEAYAYPVLILNYHEIVSHVVNGRAVMATYCPLCRSGVVYDRVLEGQTLLFGNTSALYESDMVMVDHATGSYWVQVSGEAVVGPLTGTRLTPLPSQMTTWGQWKELHPETLSLSRRTGHRRNYDRDPFVGYAERLNESRRFAFPVSEAVLDERLEPGEVVLGVEIGALTIAYPLERLGDGVLNDEIEGTAVVIFSSAEGPAGAAYLALVDGEPLTFSFEAGVIRDEKTGSVWNFGGEAIEGELAGTQLAALPVRSTLWFALIAAYPELKLRVQE